MSGTTTEARDRARPAANDTPGDDAPGDLAGLIMMTARRIRRARMAALEPFGLSPHQAHAFLAIARHRAGPGASDEPGPACPDLRLSDLAARLRIAPRSVTEVVDALCEKDLVRRAPAPTDRRAKVVELTTHGHRLRDELGHLDQATAGIFEPLTEGERDQLRALLSRVTADTRPHGGPHARAD